MKRFWKYKNKGEQAHARFSSDETELTLETSFARLKPEDFNDETPRTSAGVLLSSESMRGVYPFDSAPHLEVAYILAVEIEASILFDYSGFLPDLPYIIEHIIEQNKLGVFAANEVAHAILLSCAEEHPGSEDMDIFDYPSTIPVSVGTVTHLTTGFLRYFNYILGNQEMEPSKYEAMSLTGYLSMFNSHLGISSLNTMVQGSGEIGWQTILYPKPVLAVGARLFEGGARMLESGLWKARLYSNPEEEEMQRNRDIDNFRQNAIEIRRLIAESAE